MYARELRILADLVALNSENPPGDERLVVQYLAPILCHAGCEVQLIEGAPGRPNLVATASCGRAGPKIILNGHLDTKPAAHSTGPNLWRSDPFKPLLVEERLYGLGSCDTKGGVAAQVTALLNFLACGAQCNGSIVFQGVADEENGSVFGTRVLFEKGLLSADFAMVAEPTSGIVTTAQLGNCWAEVQVKGVSSHAGMPWCGKDAVRAALLLIHELDQCLADQPRDRRFGPHPILNVGKFEGGDHPGTVPGSCFFRCAMRLLPGQRIEEYMSLLSTVAGRVAKRTGTEIDVAAFAGGGLDPNEVDVHHPMVQKLAANSADASIVDETGVFFGGSDAQFFGKANPPAVVLGPGSLEQAHSPNEFADIRQVQDVCSRVERFLCSALL